MIRNPGRLNFSLNSRSRVMGRFITTRWNFLFIVYSALLFSGRVFCQCPDGNFFKEQISLIHNSRAIKPQDQLKEFLTLQQKMRACHLEKDSAFMFLLQNMSQLYSRQSNYSRAIDLTNESILTAKECISNHSCNMLPLVHNYYKLYYYYHQTGQLKKKYDAVDSFIVYVLKSNSGFEIAIAPITDIADYLFNKGEYSLCSRNAKLGEDIVRKYYHGKDSIGYIVSFVNKQASALYFSGNAASAEELLEGKRVQFEETGNSKYIGAFYGLLGSINADRKNYVKALSYYQQGYRANFAIKFWPGCSQGLAYIGIMNAKIFNNYDAGLKYCTDALKYADAIDSLLILRQTANIYVLKGMYDKAQHFFQQAFNTVQQGMNETILLQNSFQFPGFNELQYLLDLTAAKGDAYVQQYYHTKNDSLLKKALGVYKKADLFLAKIKTEQQLEFASNLVWRTSARNLYEHAIEACYAGNNIEDAFYFFEKSRAILLNDQVNEQRWMADKDIAKQAVLKKTILNLERDLSTAPASSGEYLAIQNKLFTSYRELRVLTGNIKSTSPVFYQNYLDTVSINVRQLRKHILNNSKTMLEIFSGDSAVYVLYIANNFQRLTKVNKYTYDSLANLFNSLITDRGRLNKRFKSFAATAHQLYGLLFQNKAPAEGSIIISPDGVSYPFEALVVNDDSKHPDYFLNHCAISYTYSAKYLTNEFAINTGTRNSVLGMAPVQYKRQHLTELEGSDRSLENIKDYFSNGTNYVLEKATKDNFLQNFPRYSIIQLYAHAADSSNNSDPVIYFFDSPFYLSDLITDRKPITQLVVLSACETAKGKLYQGEGIFSFNRGFAALGIPAAVSTLWAVDNESTYRVTELFYKYLSQGLPTDRALQKAKLEFINSSTSKDKKLPYYWAGSILTGRVDTIQSYPRFPWKEIMAAIVVLSAMICVTKVLSQKKHQPG